METNEIVSDDNIDHLLHNILDKVMVELKQNKTLSTNSLNEKESMNIDESLSHIPSENISLLEETIYSSDSTYDSDTSAESSSNSDNLVDIQKEIASRLRYGKISRQFSGISVKSLGDWVHVRSMNSLLTEVCELRNKVADADKANRIAQTLRRVQSDLLNKVEKQEQYNKEQESIIKKLKSVLARSTEEKSELNAIISQRDSVIAKQTALLTASSNRIKKAENQLAIARKVKSDTKFSKKMLSDSKIELQASIEISELASAVHALTQLKQSNENNINIERISQFFIHLGVDLSAVM